MNERTQRKTIDNLWSAIDWARDAADKIEEEAMEGNLPGRNHYETPPEEVAIAEAIIVCAADLKKQLEAIQNLPGGNE